MIPFGKHTVTLFHRGEHGIERYIIHGASWKVQTERSTYDGINQPKVGTVCICRYENAPHGAPGDLYILGGTTEQPRTDADLARLHEKYGERAFLCELVSDNTLSGIMPHLCAKGY